MVRLTGRMTAESAKTLKDLADAATVLLERWDERDKRATESTRTQISIAVWSVGITAFLALVAVIFSSLTYFQDKHSTESENEWQVTLLQAVQEGNQRQIAVEQDNQNLRTQIHELGTEIARLATDIHTLGTRSFIPTNEATE